MLKLFAWIVFVYGVVVTVVPWVVPPDINVATDMIISGLGLLTIGEALYMLRKAYSETR
jgi:hypothetical protein